MAHALLAIATGRERNLAYVVQRESLTWGEFSARLSKPHVDKLTRAEFLALGDGDEKLCKKAQNGIKASRGWYLVGEIKGRKRNRETILARGAVVLDIDGATPALLRNIERGVTRLSRFAFFAHSTHKHTPENPRIRVVVPLAEPIAAAEYEAVARAVGRLLVRDLAGIDGASFEASRLMYWPSCPADVAFWKHQNEGEFLDASTLKLEQADMKPERADAADDDLATLGHNQRQFESFEALAEAVRAVKNDKRFDAYENWFAFVAAIHFESEGSEEGRELAHEWSEGWTGGAYSAAETDAKWDSIHDAPGRQNATGRTIIKFAREDGWRPKPKVGHIQISDASLNENLADMDAAIAGHAEGLGVYRRAGRGVHIAREREPAIFEGEKTEAWSERIVQTSPAQMQQIAMKACAFEVFDGRRKKLKRTKCPADLAAHYLQMVAPSAVPVLRALTNHPTIRPDGSVLQAPGFDAATGLLYRPDAAFPRVPDAPSMDDAKAALKRLKRVVRGFEFGSDLDRTVWLSAVLTALVRDSLPRAPIFAFDAPVPGSGKTILASGVSMIARGFTAAPTSQVDPEEERKVMASLLLRNAPFALFDNCEQPIQSATLCEIVTAPEWEARLLGTNNAPKLPTNIMVMFTGNNLEIVGDIIERTLMCRLQPTTARPSERPYGWSFEGECRENRGELVAAALTIIRGYLASGAGDMGLKASRFPEWERFARLPLAWLGEGDVIDTIEQQRQVAAAEDTDSQFLAKLMGAWWKEFGGERVCLGEIEDDSDAGLLLKLLSERFAGGNFDGLNVRAAGKFLAKHKGIIVGGKFFSHGIDRKRKPFWRLIEAGN